MKKRNINGFLKTVLQKILKIENDKSELAEKYLKGLRGLEIGASSHRSFGLNTLNVDIIDNVNEDTVFKRAQVKMKGYAAKVDIVASGDDLPFKDNVWDFVISSHVLEHFFDPIKAIEEWHRVIKPGGYICMIVPDKRKTFDRKRPRTELSELIKRHNCQIPDPKTNRHYSVWVLEDVLELCSYLNYNVIEYMETDTKVHDGFCIIIKK